MSGRRRRADADTCSKRCRQNRWRWRVEASRLARAALPMRFAYADPPYPGRAGYYPEHREVDPAALIARLVAEFPDGWALSTAADALQLVLGLCPPRVRVCSWHRAVRRTRSRRPLSAWEPLIVYGGRELPADASQQGTDALVARGRHRAFPGALVGMKPPAFAVWLFEQLGARPGDQLVDLYPGSGAIARAWHQYASLGPTKTCHPVDPWSAGPGLPSYPAHERSRVRGSQAQPDRAERSEPRSGVLDGTGPAKLPAHATAMAHPTNG